MTSRDHAAMAKVPLVSCQVCHSTWGLSRHHVVNRSLAQDDSPENLVVLCSDCHRGVHDKSIDLGQYLTRAQAAKAVLLLGTLSRAYFFLYPSESPKRIERAA